MKQIAILAVAVILLICGWLVYSHFLGRPKGPAELVIPKDPTDKRALVRGAAQLWNAKPNYYAPTAVVRYLTLLLDSLDDEQWRVVSAPALFAFDTHRALPEVRAQVVQLEAKLLPRVTRTGAAEELAILVRASNSRGFDQKRINEEFDKLVADPVPVGGFPGSRQQELIGAAFLAEDYVRARDYLSRLSWPSDAGPELRAGADLPKEVADLCQPPAGERPNFQAVVRTWRMAGDDLLGRRVYRPLLEGLAARSISENLSKPGENRSLVYFKESLADEGARDYWDRFFVREIPVLLKASGSLVAEIEGLVVAYVRQFERPDYDYHFWIKVGGLQATTVPDDILKPGVFYRRALAAATKDQQRLEALRLILAGYYKAREFARAKLLAEEVEGLVRDEEVRKAVKALADEARSKAGDDLARVAKQESVIDSDRKRGRLEHMKERLADARKNRKPDAEIRALEKAVRELAAQVSE